LVDSSHGSAYLNQVPDGARRDISEIACPPYRGCTSLRPRRGVARTRPWAARLAAADHDRRRRDEAAAVAAIVLDLGEAPYAGVPCWNGRLDRWTRWTVPIAYDCRYDTQVRPVMGANQISRKALLTIAAARARYADHPTGRNCRPSNERLAADTGYSVRTVQRADTALRLLGVATEVLRAARAAAEAMRERLSTPVLCQGDDSTAALVQRFAANPATSLFGTLSLWQGVDVPGPSLSLVVIDRIPFPRPDDPLLSARQRAVSAHGGNGFMAVAASHAALLLAQGAGRLLRSVGDRGVIAVLDSRMVTARYGGYLRASLPPFWQTTDAAQVRRALDRLRTSLEVRPG
jgi:hypothetical protein